MRLHAIGRSSGLAEPVIARVTTRGVLRSEARDDHALVWREGTPPDDTHGYAAVVCPEGAPAWRADAPVVHSLPGLEYLADGDVVHLHPAGFVRTLYRRSSPHNFILATDRCNSLCLMCSQPPRAEDDSHRLAEHFRLIDLIDPETKELGITGGEPTLFKDGFLRIVEHCKERLPNTALHVLTNGRLFYYREFARRLGEIAHPDVMLGMVLLRELLLGYNPPLTLFHQVLSGQEMKRTSSPFKWRHYAPDVILLCVRWYCRYSLSYRDLEEMMRERGLAVDHVTIFRWVQRYAPEINKRMRPHLKMSGTSYRLDETYVKVGAEWKYLYRAVDSVGCTIEFMLSTKRDVSAAKRFFKKLMRADHRRLPFTVGTDKHASYPEAFATSVKEKVLPPDCKLRRVKYLNNVIEQDHRFIRRRWRAMQCFRSFHTAERTLEGVEAAHMMRKGQVKRIDGRDSVGQAKFVASLFGVAA